MDPAVGLVKTYLELSGYFVLAELPVRTPEGTGYRDVTDLDIIAVRFPHRLTGGPARAMRPLDVLLGADPELGVLEDGVDVIIGEVKEGEARLNLALHRAETAAFALRRVGCCPEELVDKEARRMVRDGVRELRMPGHVPCRVRLVAFAGHGTAAEHGVRTTSLGHCARFIAGRLRDAGDVLAGVQFKDPVLGLIALQEKLDRRAPTDGPRNPASREKERAS